MADTPIEWKRAHLRPAGGGERCVPNIGPEGRAMRRRFGAILVGVGVVAAAGLIAADAPWATRSLLFLPFAAGTTSWAQATEHT
jgi:hypothetical protein